MNQKETLIELRSPVGTYLHLLKLYATQNLRNWKLYIKIVIKMIDLR